MKIAMAQLNFTVGDLDGNTKKILNVINELQELEDKDLDMVVFSELAISGYPPLDLVERKGFVEEQLKKFDEIKLATTDLDFAVVIGYIGKNFYQQGKKFHNALAVFYKGETIHTYAKHYLPTYNIFDEYRHFEPGTTNMPLKFRDKKIGFIICEDAWNVDDGTGRLLYDTKNNPLEELRRNGGVDLIVSINASPANVMKFNERLDLCTDIAKEYDAPVIYVNQTGANDDIVFDGLSFVTDGHEIKARMKTMEEGVDIIDTEDWFSKTPYEFNDILDFRGYRIPWVSPNEIHLAFDNKEQLYKTEEMANYIISGIQDYLKKTGFEKVVIGSSGGIDSAVVTALAYLAVGKENVICITMPGPYSSEGSVDDSVELCKNFGIKLYNVPIKEQYHTFKDQFYNSIIGPTVIRPSEGIAEQNIQARLRGMVLMTFSNKYNALVLSTGNKSEMSVGYCTQYGDMCGGLGPISDVYKMEVYDIAKYLNTFWFRGEFIPQAIIDKAPSAELAPNQKDTDSLPPYPILDAILKLYIEGDLLPTEEFDKCRKMIENCDDAVIEKVIKMVDRNEFKRRQAPPTIRVQRRAFGSGRRLPIAQKYNIVPNLKNAW